MLTEYGDGWMHGWWTMDASELDFVGAKSHIGFSFRAWKTCPVFQPEVRSDSSAACDFPLLEPTLLSYYAALFIRSVCTFISSCKR